MGAASIVLAASLAVHPLSAPPQNAAQCLRALSALPEGSMPAAAAFERAACPGREAGSAFRYDRSLGVTRLARSIAVGEVVPMFPEFGGAVVVPGQKLHLVVAVGGVRIEREVEALQAARAGQKLFVRSGDGQILSARFEAGEP